MSDPLLNQPQPTVSQPPPPAVTINTSQPNRPIMTSHPLAPTMVHTSAPITVVQHPLQPTIAVNTNQPIVQSSIPVSSQLPIHSNVPVNTTMPLSLPPLISQTVAQPTPPVITQPQPPSGSYGPSTAAYPTTNPVTNTTVAATPLAGPQINLNPPVIPQKDPFSIKVMRLPPPFPAPSIPASIAPLVASRAESAGTDDATAPPVNAETIYLGETFRACVTIYQQSYPSITIHSVGIKIELQSSSRRWTLIDTTAPPLNVSMIGGSNKDFPVSHNLTELGVNCLVCLVSYKDELGERRSFQKFFKFHVHDPFTIHTTIHARESVLLAEVNLTNLVTRGVFLSRVQFEPADTRIEIEDLNGFEDNTNNDASLTELNSTQQPVVVTPPRRNNVPTDPLTATVTPVDTSNPLVRSRGNSLDTGNAGLFLLASSSRTFLFRFTINSSYTDALLGRLQIRWRSATGEQGRIKSSGISRTPKSTGGIECMIQSAPAEVDVEEVFPVRAIVKNNSPMLSLVVVQLLKDRMGTLMPHGPSTRQLGFIQPGGTIPFEFELCGVGLGVQRISGVRILLTHCHPGTNQPNLATTISQDFDHLHQLEVIAPKNRNDS